MDETPETVAPETTEQKPEPVEPGPDASVDAWVHYINQKYPRHGVTAPGSHMGRR
ncbi:MULTISPECIES: hypothetical protein [Amycolatopsis]|uniref:Uncharacterized protein n=1 Tax=Amycolatopsis dendrobii TaxID=2760662 RepID=A0A7W3VVI7_9PSEU|nr:MULTISPECIES: hypothetical protein [Amycolatopsis]MBB1154014.1 hypothetical protein [Amycolatopsis dendrobii]UKD55174.1 hypothetical protein L3Q65_46230 [Amycolatopsis sp. FU40]